MSIQPDVPRSRREDFLMSSYRQSWGHPKESRRGPIQQPPRQLFTKSSGCSTQLQSNQATRITEIRQRWEMLVSKHDALESKPILDPNTIQDILTEKRELLVLVDSEIKRMIKGKGMPAGEKHMIEKNLMQLNEIREDISQLDLLHKAALAAGAKFLGAASSEEAIRHLAGPYDWNVRWEQGSKRFIITLMGKDRQVLESLLCLESNTRESMLTLMFRTSVIRSSDLISLVRKALMLI